MKVLCFFMKKILSGIMALVITFAGLNPAYAIGWGFQRGKNGEQAQAGAELDLLLEKYNGFYKGQENEKIVYLTFDNGYENGYTKKVLDVLKKNDVKATFFITGHYIESATDLTKRMVKEGHIIGNHSWSHPDFSKVSNEQIKRELERLEARVKEVTGQKKTPFIRTPRGNFSEESLKYTDSLGYRNAFWSVAYVDWKPESQHGADYAYEQIMSQIHPGAVIMLHSVSKDNADALDKVIKDIKSQGYTFKNLDEFVD